MKVLVRFILIRLIYKKLASARQGHRKLGNGTMVYGEEISKKNEKAVAKIKGEKERDWSLAWRSALLF